MSADLSMPPICSEMNYESHALDERLVLELLPDVSLLEDGILL